MFYLARVITAAVLCVFLARLNLWVNPIENSIFVFCYRVLLLLAPFFLIFFGQRAIILAFFVSLIGIAILSKLTFLAVILIPLGFSVSSYLLKVMVASTPEGAANYKIAFNIGSFLSGIILFLFASNSLNFYIYMSILFMGVGAVLIFNKKLSDQQLHISHQNNRIPFNASTLGWALLGIATGIKFTAMFSVLPQAILNKLNVLPAWYGAIVAINSIIVIFLQKSAMRFMKKFALRAGIMPLFFSMLIIAVTEYLHVQNFFFALIWITLLSVLEVCLSYLDTLSTLRGSLLLKESFIGLGGFLTVLFSRKFADHGALMIGALGLVVTVIGYQLLILHERKRVVS